MNQGRIWCVVKPTVGLPLLIGSVAVTSLVVHASILSHTSWMGAYWQGGAKAKTAMNGAAPAVAANAGSDYTVSVAPVATTAGKTESSFVVTVAPKTAIGGTPTLAAADSK